MVDTICLYTKNEETNYLNKRRNMTTKYEKLFNGELPEEHISQATNILGQETRNMTKEILKTHKISIEKYLFLA